MSFSKKLNHFLLKAENEKIINKDVSSKLQNFAISLNSKSSINIFIRILGFIGGLTMLLGLILIISHNWQTISNFTKISIYIITLAAFYLSGFYLSEKYPRISSALYFIGAGYVIAGIGLIAQIYHLSSTDGRAFLLWCIMITPLAIALKHKWIGVLSIFSFHLWLDIYLTSNGYIDNFQNEIIYYTIVSINLILIPKIFNSFNDCFSYVGYIGYIMLLVLLTLMGFSDEIYGAELGKISIHPIVILILLFNIGALLYLITKDKNIKFSYNTQLSILLIFIAIIPFLITGKESFLMISMLYWVATFLFGAFLIYQGGIQEDSTLINCGTWLIALEIIIRFVDIIGTMLFTGYAFIIFGSILLLTAFLGEKYRKHLIKKISTIHG